MTYHVCANRVHRGMQIYIYIYIYLFILFFMPSAVRCGVGQNSHYSFVLLSLLLIAVKTFVKGIVHFEIKI